MASKYLNNPLLVENRKFDLRIYVLVRQFAPLEAYVYQRAFCRFCTEEYDQNFTNLQTHLTNVAINRPFDQGTKLSLENLYIYLKSRYPYEVVLRLQQNILKLITLTLLAVKGHIGYARNAFELYGFDVLIDDAF